MQTGHLENGYNMFTQTSKHAKECNTTEETVMGVHVEDVPSKEEIVSAQQCAVENGPKNFRERGHKATVKEMG